jgi:hypothetical protein
MNTLTELARDGVPITVDFEFVKAQAIRHAA